VQFRRCSENAAGGLPLVRRLLSVRSELDLCVCVCVCVCITMCYTSRQSCKRICYVITLISSTAESIGLSSQPH